MYSVVSVAEELKKACHLHALSEHAADNHWCSTKSFADTVRSVRANVLRCLSAFIWIIAATSSNIFNAIEDGFIFCHVRWLHVCLLKKISKGRVLFVERAHKIGAEVEAELGHVGMAATVLDQSDADKYTKAGSRRGVLRAIRCDSMPSRLHAHGFYKETPKLDLNRLRKSTRRRRATGVHGGSGIPMISSMLL